MSEKSDFPHSWKRNNSTQNYSQPRSGRKLRVLRGLQPKLYQHPQDTQAIEKLKKVPGFDMLTRKLWDLGFDRMLSVSNLASSIRIGPNQYPKLYRLVDVAARVLDVPRPEVYLKLDPTPKAYATGVHKPMIVLTTGLLESFTPTQVFCVIGHELGHIKSGHVFYSSMAQNIAYITSVISEATLGMGGIMSRGLQLALLEWYRKSEFTADRAALLAVQDIDTALSVIMQLCGAHVIPKEQRSIQEFITQARELEGETDNLNRFWKWIILLKCDHPFGVLRATELLKWYDSGNYQRILDGAI